MLSKFAHNKEESTVKKFIIATLCLFLLLTQAQAQYTTQSVMQSSFSQTTQTQEVVQPIFTGFGVPVFSSFGVPVVTSGIFAPGVVVGTPFVGGFGTNVFVGGRRGIFGRRGFVNVNVGGFGGFGNTNVFVGGRRGIFGRRF